MGQSSVDSGASTSSREPSSSKLTPPNVDLFLLPLFLALTLALPSSASSPQGRGNGLAASFSASPAIAPNSGWPSLGTPKDSTLVGPAFGDLVEGALQHGRRGWKILSAPLWQDETPRDEVEELMP